MVFKSTISPVLKLGLGLIGVWPDVPYAVARRLILVLCTLFLQYFQYMYIIAHCKLNELQNVVYSLPATFYYSLTVIKMIILWKYQGVVRELLDIVDTDWHESVNIDQYLHIMTVNASISQFYMQVLLVFNTIAGILYFGSDSIIAIMEGVNVTSRPLPMRLQLPFDAQQSPIYELLVVFLFTHSMITMYTVNILSSLVLALVFHVCGQIDILCQELKIIVEKTHYGSMVYAVRTLIEKHNKVIAFSENVDKLFSFIALMQVFCNTLVICFLGLVLMTSHNDIDLVLLKTIWAYMGITVEIFLYCFVGEYLDFKNKSIGDAAYQSLWYNMSSSHGKTLLFVILRSQKQQTITVGGITNLSLEVFTSSQYVFVTLRFAMQEK